MAVIHDEWRFVYRNLLDASEAICCLERKYCTGGNAPDKRCATRFVDEGFDVFELALHRIGRCITAVASTPTIVGEDREVLRQQFGERPTRPEGSIAERALHQNHRRSVTDAIEGNRCAMLREEFFQSSHLGCVFNRQLCGYPTIQRSSRRF